MITAIDLETMRNIDISIVKRGDLIDIATVEIDRNLPKTERIIRFIEDIKNPYCFKCSGIIVKLGFNPQGDSLQEKVVNIIKNKSK